MFNNSMQESSFETTHAETIIGPSVQVEGDLKSEGNVNIEGAFKGTLGVAHKLHIGKDAVIDAQVNAGNAFVAGHIKGDVTVKERLELSSTGKIDGDVKAGILVMDAGACLNGTCTMGQSASKSVHNIVSSDTIQSEKEADV